MWLIKKAFLLICMFLMLVLLALVCTLEWTEAGVPDWLCDVGDALSDWMDWAEV